jgi:ABC-type transport system involved in multi-copper enzyme maturation permease subunit
MRPYLTIIKDSFREAFVSRVLWMVLIILSLLLLLVFPLSYELPLTTEFSKRAILDQDLVLENLAGITSKQELVDDSRSSLLAEISKLIPDDQRKKLNQLVSSGIIGEETPANNSPEEAQTGVNKNESGRSRRNLATAILNGLIANQDLGSLNPFPGGLFSSEAQALSDATSRSKEQSKRLNRLILEQVFESAVMPGPRTSIEFNYLGMKIPGKFEIERERLLYSIRVYIKYGLNFVFNTLGILMALIITANIIPQTFDPGSLNLLMSKPISRWKLFIAQYLGGCAFVTLTMSFFFTGVWLFLGTRMGYWNIRLLLYIPSFIGIFAVYYSASAVAGLVWRSPIVSVVAGAALWLLTFVGFFVNIFCEASFNNVAFNAIDVHNEEIFVSHVPENNQKANQWNSKTGQWDDISIGINAPLGLSKGPFFSPSTNLVLGIEQRLIRRPFGPPIAGSAELLALNLDTPREGFQKLDIGLSSVGAVYRRKDGRLVLLAGGRLHLLEKNNQDNLESEKQDGISIKKLGPDKSIRTAGVDTAIAFNPFNDAFAVLRRGKFSLFAPNEEGKYVLKNEVKADYIKRGSMKLAFNGNRLILFHETLGVLTFDAQDFSQKASYKDVQPFVPSSLVSSPDGKWIAALRPNETVWIYAVETGEFVCSQVSREAKAIAFNDKSELFIGDRWLRIIQVSLVDNSIKKNYRGNLTSFQRIYKRIIYPLYFVFPKWGELNYTVEYLITGSDTADTFATSVLKILNFDQLSPFPLETYNLRPWPQVWNALGFICLVMAIGCWIIERTDY